MKRPVKLQLWAIFDICDFAFYSIQEIKEAMEKADSTSTSMIKYNGRVYQIFISSLVSGKGGSDFVIYLWDYKGSEALPKITAEVDGQGVLTKECYTLLARTLTGHENGEVECGRCGMRMGRGEIVGQIYAGRYCGKCVSTSWYEREKSWEGK